MNIADLLRTLGRKAGFELVEQTSTPGQLRLLGRIPLDRASVNMNNWLIVIRQLLSRSAEAETLWKTDVSKHYFLLNGKVVYAWRVIFQADSVEAQLADIIRTITEAPPSSRSELTEMALPGVTADRNSTVGGRRGAGLVDRVPIGPMAVEAKRMGM